MSEALSLIDLTPGEIERLPASLRRKIGGSSRSEDPLPGAWLLVGERAEGRVELLERALEVLPSLAAERGSRLSEANIEKILDVILSDAPRPRVENELEIDNARLRSRYLQQTSLLTGAEVRAASGLNPRNKSEPASRWKREGRLFAVRRSGVDHYPAFQFADGAPRPVIKEVLSALPKDMTAWQIAMWFASGNGWLDGDEPQECLSAPDAVVEAARRLADPALG